MKKMIHVLLFAALSLSFAIHTGDEPSSPSSHNDDLQRRYGCYIYKATNPHYHERDDSSQHSSTSWVTEDDTSPQDSLIPSWISNDNHNKDDDFDDETYQDSWVDRHLSDFLEKEHFRAVNYTPEFYAALDKVIEKKMKHFYDLQFLHNNKPNYCHPAKKDRAQIRNRKLAYKERDRNKNNPYTRDRRDEDDSVKAQARIAKILWAASSHRSPEVRDRKHESHGKRAYAQYLHDLSQQNLQQHDAPWWSGGKTSVSYIERRTRLYPPSEK